MIINRIYEHQNLLSLWFVSVLVGLRTYQQSCTVPLAVTFKTLQFTHIIYADFVQFSEYTNYFLPTPLTLMES